MEVSGCDITQKQTTAITIVTGSCDITQKQPSGITMVTDGCDVTVFSF